MSRECELESAEGLIRLLAQREAQHLRERESLRFGLLPLEQEPAHFGEVPRGARMLVLVGTSRPKRVFVELERVAPGASVDHRAQTAVSDRERFDPGRGGLRVPECERRGRVLGAGRRRGAQPCEAEPLAESPSHRATILALQAVFALLLLPDEPDDPDDLHGVRQCRPKAPLGPWADSRFRWPLPVTSPND